MADEKAPNMALAKKHIFVEHAIRGINRKRIAADNFAIRAPG